MWDQSAAIPHRRSPAIADHEHHPDRVRHKSEESLPIPVIEKQRLPPVAAGSLTPLPPSHVMDTALQDRPLDSGAGSRRN